MFSIWEGCYPDYAAAPGDLAVTGQGQGGFEGAEWLDKMVSRAERGIAVLQGLAPASEVALSRDYPLATVAALTPGDPLRILDFGGGLANGYANLKVCLPSGRAVRFHCVENEAICRLGRSTWGGVAPDLAFHSDLDSVPDSVDIVHAGSALQYIEDWRGLVGRLLERKPRYLVLSDVPAGAIPTFVALQAYYGRRMRHWFWNIDEFVASVEALGVRLLYRSRFEGIYLGIHGPYPMDNFDPRFRLGYSANLIFRTSRGSPA